MIQRQHLPRTLHHLRIPLVSSTCRTCSCRCGSSFNPSPPYNLPLPLPKQQRRPYSRRAPSTIDRAISRESIPRTPTQLAAWKTRQSFHTQWFARQIDKMSRTGTLQDSTPETIFQFLTDFTSAAVKFRGQSAIDPNIMIELLGKHAVTFTTAQMLSRVLLRDDNTTNLYMGKKLLYSLSRAGYVDATIRVVANAVSAAKRKPGLLKGREIAFAREHLTRVAKSEAGNFRAMVLEGKVALNLGKEEYAIEMLNKAMDAAVEAGEFQLAESRARNEELGGDALELTAPWHELMQVHWYRSTAKGLNEYALCERAMDIGCQQDDPLAHQFKADYVKRWDNTDGGEGEAVHIGTSEWLYHITKAASSGVTQAAHDLGIFYAESGWKYIEDEPPDHVKPTPFDTYPPTQPSTTTFWNRILHFSGLKARNITPEERTFHNAIFPHTAVDRLRVALGWLEQAMEYNYAASFLMTARLYNRKTLWAQADAPKAAVKLKNARYTYSSQENFRKNKPITSIFQILEPLAKPDPPNPFYNPSKARHYLREVFAAYEAFGYESRMKVNYERARNTGTGERLPDADDALSLDAMVLKGGLPPRLGKWFKFPEVRELNGEKIKGLWEEAKVMCEEEGWLLVDEEGGLVYKSGVKEKRL